MTNQTLAKRNTTDTARVADIFDPFRSLFETSPFGQFFKDYTWPQSNLMKRSRNEDGSILLEYNVAGFKPSDIGVKFDTVAGELLISAKSEDNSRQFTTVLALPQYASPEDVATSYDNGVLSLSIAPLEKRKEEAIVDIPLTAKTD